MKTPAQQETIQACLLTGVLNLSSCDNYTLYYTVKAIMTAQVVSLLCICLGHFRQSLRHISHKGKVSTYILPRDWNSLQLFDCPATQSQSLLLCSAVQSR